MGGAPGSLLIDLVRRYPSGPAIAARASPDLTASPITVLFGESGAGKTTVLRCIAGLARPDSGRIALGDQVWFDAASGVRVPPQRRGIGYVPQEGCLFPHLSVRENIGYGVQEKALERTAEVAALAGVTELLDRRPGELSSGQRQRVALARALAPRPRLLLLDEPLSSIDAPSRDQLRAELRSVILRSATPAIIVTHDRAEAMMLADSMMVMCTDPAGGSIRQTGLIEDVFNHPADAAVAKSLGMETIIQCTITGTDRGLATITAGRARLAAANPSDIRGPALACIRAADVILRRGQDSPDSARNHLAARVEAIDLADGLARVRLECGFALTALITRQSCEDLALAPGITATAVIKATAIHLIPRAAI